VATKARTAIVTGGSGGIGRVAAERLARDGLAVVIAYAGNRSRAEEAAAAIAAAGGDCAAFRADVSNGDEVEKLFDDAEERYGGIDVLVHTAGIMELAPLVDLDLAVLDKIWQINGRGTFAVNQQAARRLRPGGSIVNFSTSVTRLALPSYSAYAASKGAVEAITMILAKELRGRDITVNAVAPGPTATPLFLDGKDQATVDHLASMPPLERLGMPADIAEVVSFLAGPARWINGQVIYANGGIT
jgi:3-oxoacyl-[acyl-carrier protein] reductase